MADAPRPDPAILIGGHYEVDLTRSLPDAGGGLPAWQAVDRRTGDESFMAILVDRYAPPPQIPPQLLNSVIDGLAVPLGYGSGPATGGREGFYIISQAPQGPPVSTDLRPWPEAVLMESVFRPIVLVLEQLHAQGLTHRAIRPNNVFRTAPNSPVLLGSAWTAPPAMHQPAVFETPYSALCHPAARGPGRIADDVYALGVLLVALALGRMPMEGLDDATIRHRKLDLGDFAAITGGERLPPVLNDIVRGMLAEDPEHRPPPSLLRDTAGVRSRRIAARAPARSARPYKIGETAVWNTRTLALAIATHPPEALEAMQNGTMMFWLRRGLGEPMLAVKLEELFRHYGLDAPRDPDGALASLIMRATATADPLMPLCWGGLAMFPDGFGSLLAASLSPEADLGARLHAAIVHEAAGSWSAMREDHNASPAQRSEAQTWRATFQIKGPAGGLRRLAYTLNPLLPCLSPLFEDRWIVDVKALPSALDAAATAAPDSDLLEPHVIAFLAARSDRTLDQEIKDFSAGGPGGGDGLAALRLLSALQKRHHPGPLTGIAAWISAVARPQVEAWKNRERRAEIEETLKSLAAAGMLAPILALLEDPAGRAEDAEGLKAAQANLAHLDAVLTAVSNGSEERAAVAERLGHEIAAGAGLTAAAISLLMAAFG